MNLRPLSGIRRPGQPGRPQSLLALPVALIVGVVVASFLTPPRVHLGPLLVAAPAFTVAFAGAMLTGAVGALAVAAEILIGVQRGTLGSANILAQMAALIGISALCVGFCLTQDRSERRLGRVQSVAETAQRVLLRPLPERSGPLVMAGLYLAAHEEAELGGDLYAAARTANGSTRLLIGDVRGSGLAAINYSGLLLGAFRAEAHRQPTLPALAAHLDGALRWDSVQWRTDTRPETGEVFATAVLLDIPDDGTTVEFVPCGHPPPLVLRGDGVTAVTARASHLPIGLGGLGGLGGPVGPDAPAGASDAEGPGAYGAETFTLRPGDVLLLYTDGVTEARDGSGTFYPLAERAAAWAADAPDVLLARLREDLMAHAGGRLGDDAAAVAIRREAADGG
ncbi:serine/threonine-protein phosphatase [Streptomyces sp. NBC_00433]